MSYDATSSYIVDFVLACQSGCDVCLFYTHITASFDERYARLGATLN